MNKSLRISLRLLLLLPLTPLLSLLPLLSAQTSPDPFAEGVRSSAPLTPLEQLKTFHLPPGFTIELVASEPDIAKPMNLAFDSQNRLWISMSTEYPFPAPPDRPATDSIKYIPLPPQNTPWPTPQTFVSDLNIPIGLYPYGQGVISWSISSISYLRDTTGNGQVDSRNILFGPLGTPRDTHGMQNAFRRGLDGWLYICHGFNNDTTLQSASGQSITLNSGNTYRIQLDGSDVQQRTWGQVNPFGSDWDDWGNLYTADCHTAPIYQIIPGGYYPSFGKPHDGLGFAPTLMTHSHGSTAIAGLVYLNLEHWPEEYRDNIFVGNVMTSRINRDRVTFSGSTPTAVELPDFLTCDDPWFRPVDLQIGPDGALYIADFYNRIIGHYEVPLQHPGRDRHRGRIWRVQYTGTTSSTPNQAPLDFTQMALPEILENLGHPNRTRRLLATHYLADVVRAPAITSLTQLLTQETRPPLQRIHAAWVLARLNALTPVLWKNLASDPQPLVRAHALKTLNLISNWDEELHQTITTSLFEPDAKVRRAAVEATLASPQPSHIRPLLTLLQQTPSSDTHLAYHIKVALRDHLKQHDAYQTLTSQSLSPQEIVLLGQISLAVPTPAASEFLLHHLQSQNLPLSIRNDAFRHIARNLPESRLDELANLIRLHPNINSLEAYSWFKSIQQGTSQRGSTLSPALQQWGTQLATSLLNETLDARSNWSTLPHPNNPESENPWFLQERKSSDGNSSSWFLCSLPPGGERFTGILQTRPFPAPSELTFYLAGHDGYPEKPAQGKNFVRILDAETRQEWYRHGAPRNDIAQKITWDLRPHQGKPAILEIHDGDTGDAYAWIAIGRLPETLPPFPKLDPRTHTQYLLAALTLISELNLASLQPPLETLIQQDNLTPDLTAATASTLLTLKNLPQYQGAITALNDLTLPLEINQHLRQTLLATSPEIALNHYLQATRNASARIQTALAQSLAKTPQGADTLIQALSKQTLPIPLLHNQNLTKTLKTSASPQSQTTLQELLETLPQVNIELETLWKNRVTYAQKNPGSPNLGKEVFAKNCQSCHQAQGAGGRVGPQLDGIGGRGLERLAEDILLPNRNVDPAFRTRYFILKDGDLLTGLPLREEGALWIAVDTLGNEFSIPKAQLEKIQTSDLSLMPENFGELIPKQDWAHLLAYLLQLK